MTALRRSLLPLKIAALLIAPLLIGGCKKNVDPAKLQTAITADFATKGIALAAVSCPPAIPSIQTAPFNCTATYGTSPISVAVTPDGKGNFSFLTLGLIDETKVTDVIEPKLKANTGLDIDIQCPKAFLVAHNGDKFSCPAVVSARQESVDCTITDATTDSINCVIRGLISEKTASDAVEESFLKEGKRVDIICPSSLYIVGHTGVAFSCPATLNSKPATADCTFKSPTYVDCRVHF